VQKVATIFSVLTLLVGTLHGQVMRGPTTPVCRVGQSCEAPAKHIRLFFSRSGDTTTALTDAKGLYRVKLPEGRYSVRTDQRPFGTVPEPRTVRVVAKSVRRVDFHIDTGIR
jgi:hypothetical protein